jgi:[protein-PII] uridylyltransferase
MSTVPPVRQCVQDAKRRLGDQRRKAKRQHELGLPAADICDRLADTLDVIVLDIFEAALAELAADDTQSLLRNIALVPHAGYGRRDVAPYSDLDLMLLYEPQVRDRVDPLAKRLLMDIFDAGLSFGHSVRTTTEACQLAWSDATIYSSLAESRYLAGSVSLYTKFVQRFRRGARRRFSSLHAAVVSSREEERFQYGQTVYLLEPNLKRSVGGLRDLQLIRWLGFARYGTSDLDELRQVDGLKLSDHRRLHEAYHFLLRLRNELHFHADKAQDVLDRREQLRIATLEGYPGAAGVLPVEQFMREYFHHTSQVQNTVDFFVAKTRPRELAGRVLAQVIGHRVEGDFYVGQRHIRATRRGRTKLRGDLEQVLRLMDLANLYGISIDHDTWEAIRDDMVAHRDVELTPEAIRRFLSLMSEPKRLGQLLRRLHELRVLEKIVPGMEHARCLLQFNEYHKYTVDEHSFRAVEAATDYLSDEGPLGESYRSIRQKRTLHLALLIHDLGKGYPEDHCVVGGRLAERAAELYALPPREAETLRFLVQRHLLMNQLAFRRDTHDETVLLQFAAEVGSPDVLTMLFVHTCADMAAVGSGVLNQWKVGILTDLYDRTMQRLTGDTATGMARQHADERRRQAKSLIAPDPDADWLAQQIDLLPVPYLDGYSHQDIVEQLVRLRRLNRTQAIAWARHWSDGQVVEYTVGTYEDAVPGIFHRLTGVLASQGCSILSAEIHTLADQLVLDRFYVEDTDHSGPPPPERLDAVRQKLVRAVEQPSDKPPAFRRVWQTRQDRTQTQLSTQRPRVSVDNTTSERYTILDVFTVDRMGLLYAITRTLFELGLSVWAAKIGTFLDQVVDVFYVTEGGGGKVEDPQRLAEIDRRILTAIEELERSAAGG